ncbi:MAG: Gfo/Idh/MocA family oxidoreductase [Propionibacteriaceae bacterium]|jgi:myo-inositol 2-dehydrogenase/D-chiro-inositol 1-dehydrogenase|nr:Gfo/Idh/MocA family oxidoreductase [Propionibacteriaceae bacterium]
MRKLSVALLGAGFIGRVHAANLAKHPQVDFRAVYDVDFARAEGLAAEFGAEAMDIEAVLVGPSIDAVLIATSTNTHAELLIQAARAGKAVFCEKPIDLDYATALAAVEAAEEADVPVMIDFCRRFDSSYSELFRAVQAGEVGAVQTAQFVARGPSLPALEYLAVSGGQERDQNVHYFDLVRWLIGEPVSVFAYGSAFTDPRVAEIDDVDTSVTVLKLASGAIATIEAVRSSAYGYDERVELNGTKAMLEASRQRTGWVNRYGPGTVCAPGLHAEWLPRLIGTFGRALDEFVDAVLSGRPPSASLRDGLQAQLIADCATKSLATGVPVEISNL